MLTILPFNLSVKRHLICGNNKNWLLKLNLIYKTLCKKWLVDINAGETRLVLDVKIDGSILEEKSSFKILRLTFSSKLH